MPVDNELRLIAHLMRRAGFGATRDELEQLVGQGYEAAVEVLLDPVSQPELDMDRLYRRLPQAESSFVAMHVQTDWMYRMRYTSRHLQEKMALFWHYVFATGVSKVEQSSQMANQVRLFRKHGMGNYRRLLIELAKDPAMIFWLDNQDNHKRAPNENWGRELLELFSIGVGNYTEEDVYECSRAFTGWSFEPSIPSQPWGQFPWVFQYRADDHDGGEKSFLGQTGRFNGEDIIDIVVRQPACATFICRHLYNFFVAEEPQVPAWSIEPPGDPEAVELLARTFVESDYEITPVLRTLFNSDFFKEARFKRVKCPAELVAGIIKLVGTHRFPTPGFKSYSETTTAMGQQLLDPPSVEGWHTGQEWINGGTLNERVNFAVNELGDATKPGVKALIDRLTAQGTSLAPEDFVDGCLDLVGPLTVSSETREGLLRDAESRGELRVGTEGGRVENEARVVRMLQLIVATREYQFA